MRRLLFLCLLLASAGISYAQHTGGGGVPGAGGGGAPTGAAGGVLNGTYPNPGLSSLTSLTTNSILGSTAVTQLAAPSVTAAVNGTPGSTGYTYQCTAVDNLGNETTNAFTGGVITTGNATLSGSNFNAVTCATVSGAVTENVYRSASSGTPGTTGNIGSVAPGGTLNDTGLTAGAALPSSNSTGAFTAANLSLTSSNFSNTAFCITNTSTNGRAFCLAAGGQFDLPGLFSIFDNGNFVIPFGLDGVNNRFGGGSATTIGWYSSTYGSGSWDTGLSRDSAGVVDCGNGTQGNKTCTLNVGKINVLAARKGTFVCTGAGTITIANANEAATSDVVISMNAQGGTITTPPAMKTVTAGTGFTVLCGATDTSTYNYDILN